MTQEITGYRDEGPAAYLAHIVGGRHRAVQDVARWFDYRHLPHGLPRKISHRVAGLACTMLDAIDVDDPELKRGLSRLLEAKDCFVRAAIAAQQAESARDALDAQSLHDSPGSDL
jgi:hypothetical protein